MKYIILLSVLITSPYIWSKSVGRVVDVKGNAFSFHGKTPVVLKYGSEVEDMSDIMVEDGAILSVVTNQEQLVHLSGGTLVKIYSGLIELKNGNVWVDSNSVSKGMINTSNSVAQYTSGQFIYSFDNITGKTQVLVLRGDVQLSNALEPSLVTKVSSGLFSMVDPKYENGLPRTPTKVGLKSYKETKNLFVGFKSIEDSSFEQSIWGEKRKETANASVSSFASREIASVTPSEIISHAPTAKKGRLIFVRTIKNTNVSSRNPASVAGPMDYYMKMKKKIANKNKPEKNNKVAPIRYFGLQSEKQVNLPSKTVGVDSVVKDSASHTMKTRMPASVSTEVIIKELKTSGFEKSLNQEVPKMRRNSDEVNHLIDELKTYDQDFKKKY